MSYPLHLLLPLSRISFLFSVTFQNHHASEFVIYAWVSSHMHQYLTAICWLAFFCFPRHFFFSICLPDFCPSIQSRAYIASSVGEIVLADGPDLGHDLFLASMWVASCISWSPSSFSLPCTESSVIAEFNYSERNLEDGLV